MAIWNNFNVIIEDILKKYVKHRKMGRSRAEAIELIRDEYSYELQDADDRVAVLIGLSLSLCKKKELLESIGTETLKEIEHISFGDEQDKKYETYLLEVERCLKDKAVYGKEAVYKRASIYVPDWKIGDTFSHELTYPTAEKLGIKGWFILLYKVGEYIDEFEMHHQLVYVSLCPPGMLPSCEEDMQKLGFLRMMCKGDQAEYLAQIILKSKKAEEAYGLSKVGYFPDILLPDDRVVEENPLTAMPLFGQVRRDDLWPGYEDQICRLYKTNGMKI